MLEDGREQWPRCETSSSFTISRVSDFSARQVGTVGTHFVLWGQTLRHILTRHSNFVDEWHRFSSGIGFANA